MRVFSFRSVPLPINRTFHDVDREEQKIQDIPPQDRRLFCERPNIEEMIGLKKELDTPLSEEEEWYKLAMELYN